MKIVKKKQMARILMEVDDILEIVFNDIDFSIMVKDNRIYIEGMEFQRFLDFLIQQYLFSNNPKDQEICDRLLQKFAKFYS